MIDTSKAVRPCVEELAKQFNYGYTPRNFKPLWLWKDIRQYFKDTFTQNGITFTNNDDGTFTVEGTASANLSTLINNTTVPYTQQPYEYKAVYNSSSNTTAISIGKIMIFFAPLLYVRSNAYSNVQVGTKMTCVAGGQQSTTTITNALLLFQPTTGAVISNFSGRVSGNYSADEIEVSNCGFDFRLVVNKGDTLNVRFTLVAFDCMKVADSSSLEECDEIVASFGLPIDYINAVGGAAQANQVILENALWKAFDGNFESEYAPPISIGDGNGYTYYTINSNS